MSIFDVLLILWAVAMTTFFGYMALSGEKKDEAGEKEDEDSK